MVLRKWHFSLYPNKIDIFIKTFFSRKFVFACMANLCYCLKDTLLIFPDPPKVLYYLLYFVSNWKLNSVSTSPPPLTNYSISEYASVLKEWITVWNCKTTANAYLDYIWLYLVVFIFVEFGKPGMCFCTVLYWQYHGAFSRILWVRFPNVNNICCMFSSLQNFETAILIKWN